MLALAGYIKAFEKRHKRSVCYQKEPKLDPNNVGEGSLELTPSSSFE